MPTTSTLTHHAHVNGAVLLRRIAEAMTEYGHQPIYSIVMPGERNPKSMHIGWTPRNWDAIESIHWEPGDQSALDVLTDACGTPVRLRVTVEVADDRHSIHVRNEFTKPMDKLSGHTMFSLSCNTKDPNNPPNVPSYMKHEIVPTIDRILVCLLLALLRAERNANHYIQRRLMDVQAAPCDPTPITAPTTWVPTES